MEINFRSILGTVWKYFKLLFGTLLIVVAIGPLVLPKSAYLERYAKLEQEGRTINAVVTKKDISESVRSSTPTTPLYMLGPVGRFAGGFVDGSRLGAATSGRSSAAGRSSYRYYVEYQFQVPNHKTIKHQKKISLEEFDAIKVGSKLVALYHPLSPRIHRLVDYSRPFQPLDLSTQIWAAVIFGGWGAFLVWRNWPFYFALSANSSATDGLNRLSRSQQGSTHQQPQQWQPRVNAGRRPRRSGFGQRA